MPLRNRTTSSTEQLIPDYNFSDIDIQSASTSAEGGENEGSSESSKDVGLKKELGLWDGVGILVGIMVGSGIFISPTGVVQYAGSVGLSLIIWGVAGIMSTIGALCYVELGTMIPKSGGEYSYIQESFGDLLAFLYIWVSLLIIAPTANTIMSLTFSYYILQPLFGHCVPDWGLKILAALVITFLTYINCVNVKIATKISDIFTTAKISALIVIIITGIVALSHGHVENYQHPFEGSNWGFTALATSYYQGFISFAGWNSLNFIFEEIKDPYKNLPRAILISLPMVTIVYFLTNVAYFVVLSPAEVLSSNAVAVTFGNRMLGSASWIMPLFVACSTFGSINSGIFASSRLLFVGARQGQLPTELSLININNSTPVPSLILLSTLSIIMLISSDVQVLINYIAFSINIFMVITIAALLWERYKRPERHRPVKVWIGLPIIFFVSNAFIIFFTIFERPVEIGLSAAIILTGIPVYFIFIYRENKNETLRKIRGSVISFIQLLTSSCPQQ